VQVLLLRPGLHSLTEFVGRPQVVGVTYGTSVCLGTVIFSWGVILRLRLFSGNLQQVGRVAGVESSKPWQTRVTPHTFDSDQDPASNGMWRHVSNVPNQASTLETCLHNNSSRGAGVACGRLAGVSRTQPRPHRWVVLG